MVTGPDGSLWFTEFNANKIGMINPVTDGIGETLMPTPGSSPLGIGVGPDGILWVAEMAANKIGALTPTLALVATVPPSAVAPGVPFGLIVSLEYSSGLLDTAFNGDVTLVLPFNAGGATLGGTLTAAA